MNNFLIKSEFEPSGDQPKAINSLVEGLKLGNKRQTLLGATGTGKTFTISNVIKEHKRPTLVIAHNKTLAAQLCNELKDFFPDNSVEYFISYYDFYRPEAYISKTDTYIEKSAVINEEIDRLRHSATRSLFEREDVIVVASVSCIYGLGLPEEYLNASLKLNVEQEISREQIIEHLVFTQYERNDLVLERGKFRVKGDVIEIFPSYAESFLRVELFGDEIEKIGSFDALNMNLLEKHESVVIYPGKHFIIFEDKMEKAIHEVKNELIDRLNELKSQNKLVEAQRLEQKTNYDIEMMQEVGYCQGIENYSRVLSGRPPGSSPETLIDYFPDDFLTIIDESHVTLPQIRAMYNGDRSRKMSLVDNGFRLPSALDNRPLKWEEFDKRVDKVLYVSATPGDYELETSDNVAEQVIRPTGLIDPEVNIKRSENQIDDLMHEIKKRVDKNERTLVTTLTKKMAEDLCDYLKDFGIKVKYLHSDIKAIDRIEILRSLRLGEFDVLIGVNLLREGLDLPEVSLVAILDADKEGFLRSGKSLIQTMGRAARNSAGQVIMYADKMTKSMQYAMDETNRRRKIQLKHNKDNNIVPKTIKKSLLNPILDQLKVSDNQTPYEISSLVDDVTSIPKLIKTLETEMKNFSRELEFERAAEVRDKIMELRHLEKQLNK